MDEWLRFFDIEHRSEDERVDRVTIVKGADCVRGKITASTAISIESVEHPGTAKLKLRRR
jgi:hypothetical protein